MPDPRSSSGKRNVRYRTLPRRVVELRDDERILTVLDRDRVWAAYAITDLAAPYRQYARFFAAERDGELDSVLLVYAAPGFTSLLPYGESGGIATILSAIETPICSHFMVRESDIAGLESRYAVDTVERMLRMAARSPELQPAPAVEASLRRLDMSDLPAIAALYAHWQSSVFEPFMLERGIYVGAYVNGGLVAIAGTHTISSRHRVGTIGGVFTLPEYRGRGLATAAAGAVARHLAGCGVDLIALNARDDNAAAIAAYRRLGFSLHSRYLEGTVRLRDA